MAGKSDLAKDYFDMMKHAYQKAMGHSEGKKPYMESDYFSTEYPQLSGYGGTPANTGLTEPITPEPTPDPTGCLEWFEKTIVVSGNTYFQNPAFIDKIYANLEECTKLHLIIFSCLQYNSISFCICCASAAEIRGGGFATQSDCAQDFGPVADEEWRCCADPCPHFEIVMEDNPDFVCFNAVADCDVRVYWEAKTLGAWEDMAVPPNCTNKYPCKVRATDLCGNSIDYTLPPVATIITGSSTTVKSSTQQYTYDPCPCATDTPVWSVAGTGASISQSGLLTTDATACGSLLINVDTPGCQPGNMTEFGSGKTVRVTDGGTWVLVNTQTYGAGCNMGDFPYLAYNLCTYGSCDVISGDTKTNYQNGTVNCYRPTAPCRDSSLFNDIIAPCAPSGCNDACGTFYGDPTIKRSHVQEIKTYNWRCP